jgi:hypothetical protein
MVDTIGPMVRAAEDRGRRVQAAHVVGGLLGGATTGFVFGALGAVVGADESRPGWLLGSVAAAAGVAAVVDIYGQGRKLGLSRQTSRAWRHVLPAPTAAFLNGFDLGLGWSTRLYFASYLVALAAAILAGHALAGALIGAAFGGGRAAFVVLAQRRNDGSLSIDSLAAKRGRVAALNAAALVQFALAAGFTARSLG